jgi:hypothetical protein
VLANAAIAILLVSAASPAKAQDAGIVIMGSNVVVNQSPYGGRSYTTDYTEPSAYGRPAYAPDVAEPSYYGRRAYMSSYGRPAYSTERPLPSPSYDYGPLAYRASSPCYWDRQRHWDGYSWRVRRIQICD